MADQRTVSEALAEAYGQCHAWNLAKKVLIILQSVLVGIILGMRIYAMYNFSKRVLIILCGAGLITFILAVWSTGKTSIPAVGEESVLRILNTINFKAHSAIHVDRFLCDVAVFGFTFIRAYRQPIKIPGSIISFMVRDGATRIIWNRALAFVNLANILMYYIQLGSSRVNGQSWIAGSLSAFTSTLSVTMVSRLMLNLHKAATFGIFTDTQSMQTAASFQSDRICYDEEANIEKGLKFM
ncbi:hypothetical protein B0H13DRAFT_1891077 [Mycena leptocephala]|nr:hypothetical protein B0H13DRAFT_1891077 [Mycena leptocephala]